jgi:hypothetical protein
MIRNPCRIHGLIVRGWKHNHGSSQEESFLDCIQTSVGYQDVSFLDKLQQRHTRHDYDVCTNMLEIVKKMSAGNKYQLAIGEI